MALAGLVSTGCSLAAAATGSSAASVWARALGAAKAQQSVHYVEVSTGDGLRVTITGDVNRVEGTQKITVRATSGARSADSGSATITLVGGTAYVKGDAGGLEWSLGMPHSVGDLVSGRWISVTRAAPSHMFATTAAELTMASVISNFDMKGPYSFGAATRRSGVRVLGVRGYLSGTGKKKVVQTFEVRATRPLLPASSSVSSSQTRHGAMTAVYSHWGEPVTVRAPTGAIPIEHLLNGITTPTTDQIVTAAATSISTAPPRGRAATPTAERV